SERLDVLADPARRQATMRATLDASWELLDHDEREILAQTSLFAAPFGIEAAEEVCVLPAAGRLDAPEILDVVESLLRKSLFARELASGSASGSASGEGRARLRMFETVRAWARGKLAASGGEEEAILRHARYVLALAEDHAARTYGEGAPRALDALTEL